MSPRGMDGRRGLAAAFVLLGACCAFPMAPTDSSPVGGLSESADDNMWFDAMEDRPAGERVIGDASGRLGEGLPSPDEEASDMPGERGTVKNTEEDPKEPRKENPRLPDEVRNPFGQMVQDLEDMKTSEKDLDRQHTRYKKMEYYAADQQESDAVKEAVTASQDMASTEYPDPKAEEIAISANQDLVAAVAHRQKVDAEAQQNGFAQNKPVPDTPNNHGTGAFSKLYRLNLQMKKNEEQQKNMQQQFDAQPTPVKVLRELFPKKKQRQKERSQDDAFYAYHIAKDHFNPEKSKAYHDAFQKNLAKDQLMNMLSEAAQTYKSRKLSEPNLKYKDMVKGTSLQGITNFYAMSEDEMAHQTASFALQSKALNQHERNLDKMQEDYIQKYDDETRVVPFKEWQKQWNLERMVKAEVHDPDDPVTEKMIREDSAKLLHEHNNPDLEADVQTLLKARNDEKLEHDEAVARVVSQAPTKETLDKLKKEGILGAKQLAEDTKLANERLQNETAHPHHYGKEKKLNPEKEPDYTKVNKEARLKEGRELVARNQKALLVDAKRLAETGDRADQMVLEHDTKAALKGKPTDNRAQKHSVVTEQLYYDMLRSQYGNETMEDMKAGVKAQYQRSISKWDKVKDVVLAGGVGPSYGAEALKSLPTRSSGPELDPKSSISFEGNTANSDVPERKDDPPNKGTGNVPEESKSVIKNSVQEQAAEDRPRTGYAPEEEDTPTDEEAVADAKKVQASAEKEAVSVEDESSPKVYGTKQKPSATDNTAEEALNSAESQEQAIEDEADSKKAAQEISKDDEMPNAEAEKDDEGHPWDTKGAAADINQAMAGKKQATSDENGGGSGGEQEDDNGNVDGSGTE